LSTRRIQRVEPLVRVLNVVFWVAAGLFVATLVLSGFTARLFGDGGAQVVKAVLIAAVVVCSGVIALYEFRLNPMADTERGEWTSRQLFYATVFTITFFVGFLFILTVVF
jgi:hypothetical protein